LVDICQKAYQLFYQEEKKYTKIEKEDYKKETAKQKMRNIDEIL